MFQQNIAFILVRPSEPGNVGAAARVMKNFGFTDLRVVAPEIEFQESEDKWMAVGAYDLIEKCQNFASLAEAIADVSMAIGTTSARFRAVQPLPFTEICAEATGVAKANKVAWVFGNERNGLTFEELERCHSTTCVPTEAEFPVLNVAQAVSIVAYEACRSQSAFSAATGADLPKTMPTGKDEDQLFDRVDKLVKKVNFTREFNHTQVLRELRSAYQRMRPTVREYGLLNGLVLRLYDRISPRSPKDKTKDAKRS